MWFTKIGVSGIFMQGIFVSPSIICKVPFDCCDSEYFCSEVDPVTSPAGKTPKVTFRLHPTKGGSFDFDPPFSGKLKSTQPRIKVGAMDSLYIHESNKLAKI